MKRLGESALSKEKQAAGRAGGEQGKSGELVRCIRAVVGTNGHSGCRSYWR